nr:uncharacterized protein LOC127321552 [Lolium perenne]
MVISSRNFLTRSSFPAPRHPSSARRQPWRPCRPPLQAPPSPPRRLVPRPGHGSSGPAQPASHPGPECRRGGRYGVLHARQREEEAGARYHRPHRHLPPPRATPPPPQAPRPRPRLGPERPRPEEEQASQLGRKKAQPKKPASRKKAAPPPVSVPPPPSANEVLDETSAPTASYMGLLNDAEVNIGAPPLDSFHFEGEEEEEEEEEE